MTAPVGGRPLRILVVCWAWSSHYLPLVPTLWALRAAGHEVRVASQPALEKAVLASAAIFCPAGPDVDHEALRARVFDAPEPPAEAAAPTPATAGWAAAKRDRVARVFSVFGRRAELMLDDTLALAHGWQPDLVLFEPTSYAGPLVAAALDVPAVRHLHGPDTTHQAHDVVRRVVAPLAEHLGVDPDAVALLGHHTVDPCPPSMQIDTPVSRTVTRYVPYNGPATLPPWLADPPARPRVCVTWGATASSMGGQFLPGQIARALADVDVEVVLALRPDDRPRLGQLPADCRVVESLALHLLLPSCSLVIHQGGFGTTLTAADAGIPQIVMPQFPDQEFGARRSTATGAARAVPVAEFTAARLVDEVRDILSDQTGSVALATHELRADLRSSPPPSACVDDIVDAAHRHHHVRSHRVAV